MTGSVVYREVELLCRGVEYTTVRVTQEPVGAVFDEDVTGDVTVSTPMKMPQSFAGDVAVTSGGM
jgi:hypothetical protein